MEPAVSTALSEGVVGRGGLRRFGLLVAGRISCHHPRTPCGMPATSPATLYSPAAAR